MSEFDFIASFDKDCRYLHKEFCPKDDTETTIETIRRMLLNEFIYYVGGEEFDERFTLANYLGGLEGNLEIKQYVWRYIQRLFFYTMQCLERMIKCKDMILVDYVTDGRIVIAKAVAYSDTIDDNFENNEDLE